MDIWNGIIKILRNNIGVVSDLKIKTKEVTNFFIDFQLRKQAHVKIGTNSGSSKSQSQISSNPLQIKLYFQLDEILSLPFNMPARVSHVIPFSLISHIQHNKHCQEEHQTSYYVHVISIIAVVFIAQKAFNFRILFALFWTEVNGTSFCCTSSVIDHRFVSKSCCFLE